MEIKDFAWNVFYNSGNVEAFLLYKKDNEILNKKDENVISNSGRYEINKR